MKKLLVVMAILLVMPAPALAGSITLTGPTSITVPEDGASDDFTYTFSNNSGDSITVIGLLAPNGFLLSGDFSDLPSFGFPQPLIWGASGSTCSFGAFGTLEPDGFSCTLILRYVPNVGSGETDADSGTVTFSSTLTSQAGGVIYLSATGGNLFVFSPLITLTTTDPGFSSPVPEPTSLILTLTALGLAGVLARVRLRSTPNISQ